MERVVAVLGLALVAAGIVVWFISHGLGVTLAGAGCVISAIGYLISLARNRNRDAGKSSQ